MLGIRISWSVQDKLKIRRRQCATARKQFLGVLSAFSKRQTAGGSPRDPPLRWSAIALEYHWVGVPNRSLARVARKTRQAASSTALRAAHGPALAAPQSNNRTLMHPDWVHPRWVCARKFAISLKPWQEIARSHMSCTGVSATRYRPPHAAQDALLWILTQPDRVGRDGGWFTAVSPAYFLSF